MNDARLPAGETHLIDHRAALPPDIISAWFNGDYLIGDRNTNQVKHVGICLALLGTYRYITIERYKKGETEMVRLAHSGFCRIELVDQELEFHGMRVYTNPATFGSDRVKDRLALWRSDFSKIWDDGISQDLLFAYSLKVLEPGHKAHYEMDEAGTVDFKKEIGERGTDPRPQEKLSDLVKDLKAIHCSPGCFNVAEKLLSTPAWDAAWLDEKRSAADGDLFAFLRFKTLAETLRAGDLYAEYRSLAPANVTGVNVFSSLMADLKA